MKHFEELSRNKTHVQNNIKTAEDKNLKALKNTLASIKREYSSDAEIENYRRDKENIKRKIMA